MKVIYRMKKTVLFSKNSFIFFFKTDRSSDLLFPEQRKAQIVSL